MKITSRGANCTEVETKDGRFLVSYKTPVAYKDTSVYAYDEVLVTDTKHSVTTSKHISAWLKDHSYSKVVPTAQESLNRLFNQV